MVIFLRYGFEMTNRSIMYRSHVIGYTLIQGENVTRMGCKYTMDTHRPYRRRERKGRVSVFIHPQKQGLPHRLTNTDADRNIELKIR